MTQAHVSYQGPGTGFQLVVLAISHDKVPESIGQLPWQGEASRAAVGSIWALGGWDQLSRPLLAAGASTDCHRFGP